MDRRTAETCSDSLGQITANRKSYPKAALQFRAGGRGSDSHQCWLQLPTIRHEADASEVEDHHRPCRGFGSGVCEIDRADGKSALVKNVASLPSTRRLMVRHGPGVSASGPRLTVGPPALSPQVTALGAVRFARPRRAKMGLPLVQGCGMIHFSGRSIKWAIPKLQLSSTVLPLDLFWRLHFIRRPIRWSQLA